MLFWCFFFKANNLPEKISTSLHCSELNTSLLAVQLLEASGGEALPAVCCTASNASATANRNLYSTVKQLHRRPCIACEGCICSHGFLEVMYARPVRNIKQWILSMPSMLDYVIHKWAKFAQWSVFRTVHRMHVRLIKCLMSYGYYSHYYCIICDVIVMSWQITCLYWTRTCTVHFV